MIQAQVPSSTPDVDSSLMARAPKRNTAIRSRWSKLVAATAAAALLLICRAAPAAPAPPYDGFIDGAQHPIRVHYTDQAGIEVAQQVLDIAEDTWQATVVDMGFIAPTTEDEDGNPVPGMWIYVDPSAANYPETLSDNPATPFTDCTSRVVVATTTAAMKPVVTMEMAQVVLFASDCGEKLYAWKSGGVALLALSDPSDMFFTDSMLPAFQRYPNEGLDCVFVSDQNRFWYHYGAGLFWLFLDEAYGAHDGKLLAELWSAARQNGTVTSTSGGQALLDVTNSPHIYDAVQSVTGESFPTVAAEFGRWRYFVGSRDDGAHFSDASSWKGSEVAVETHLMVSDLPLAQAAVEGPVADFGSSYLELDLAGLEPDAGLAYRFAGDPAVSWSVSALLLADGKATEVRTLDLQDAASGELTVDNLDGFSTAVFVITNLSAGDHNPDAPACNLRRSFTYDLEQVDLSSPPTVTSIDPASLTLGHSYELWIAGSDLIDGLQVALGSGVEVTAVDVVDGTSVAVSVEVSAEAAPGPRDLVVTNPNGQSTTLAGVIDLLAPHDETDSQNVGGCGCRIASRPLEGHAALALALIAGALVWRRRGKRRATR